MNIIEVLERFKAYLLTEKRLSANTCACYMTDTQQFARYIQDEQLTLKEVKEDHLSQFLSYLHKRHLSSASIARKISTLKLFFSFLKRSYAIDDVTTHLNTPQLEKQLPRYLTEDEIAQVFEVSEQDSSLTGQRNHMMLMLLYVTGLRVSELVTLKYSSIRFDEGVLVVQGKGNKERLIPLPDCYLDLLQTYCTQVREPYLKKYKVKSIYLFPSFYGKKVSHITRQAFWLLLRELCKKAGITKKVSPHQIRHSFATHMLKRGAHLRALQILLGHENLSTVQRYTHLELSHVRAIYDKKHPRS